MSETIVMWRFDGTTHGLNRLEAETLRDYLFVERNLGRFQLGGRLRSALDAESGAPPLEFTLDDVPVLKGVLEGAEVGDLQGLVLLQQAVGSEPHGST